MVGPNSTPRHRLLGIDNINIGNEYGNGSYFLAARESVDVRLFHSVARHDPGGKDSNLGYDASSSAREEQPDSLLAHALDVVRPAAHCLLKAHRAWAEGEDGADAAGV